MPQKRSPQPGRVSSVSGAVPAPSTSDAERRPASARGHVLSLLVRPTTPSLAVGLGVAASLLLAETLLGFLLSRVVPEGTLGVVYLLGAVVIAMGWGFWLAAATALASTLAFDFFLLEPIGSLTVTDPRDWVALAVFLVAALSASTVADLARRAAASDHRRRAAEIAAESGRVFAEQQAALRRVATLVARGASSSEVFSAVVDELARCLGVYDHAVLFRYESDGAGVLLAAAGDDAAITRIPVGERFALDGENVATHVFRTGRPATMDSYQNGSGSIATRLRELGLQTAVGAPITVGGRPWGAAIVGSTRPEPLPPDIDLHVGDFADLVATAIADAQTRTALGVLAEQQAALRRVATLVARGASPAEVFEAVADELARCLCVMHATVSRYDAEEFVPVAIYHGDRLQKLPDGLRLPLEGDNVAARVRTGQTARMDSHDNAPGEHAARIRELGIRSAVGVPIIVDGSVWGAAIVGSTVPEPLPQDTEARISDFADLLATAIANAATRAELIASRARIVAAADGARRRLEHDLHDGAQQRLVALALQLRLAEASVPAEQPSLREQLGELVSGITGVSAELRELSHGIHPSILSKGGLGPALRTLARRSAVPVDLDLGVDRRLPDSVEVGAYYVVSEALTNVAKHARASVVQVGVETHDAHLRLSIRDDGIGGADAAKGSGLIGLIDRVEALGGTMAISSHSGSGTALLVEIPLHLEGSIA
ncbi:MAG: domain S-box [Mycobacterium sp.]|nr:domain S-box [Mycobacterium sp.]